jgi:hypothetical protein
VGKDAADRLAGHFGGVGGPVVERLNCREDDGFSFALKAAVRFRRGRMQINISFRFEAASRCRQQLSSLDIDDVAKTKVFRTYRANPSSSPFRR